MVASANGVETGLVAKGTADKVSQKKTSMGYDPSKGEFSDGY